MGSGIMFGRGDIWLTEDGLIKAVNYQSKIEASLINMINSSSKDELHASLMKYKQPVLHWETKKFMIRVDYLGKSTYRYASWSLPAIVSDKPDLILKGHREISGTAGNTAYIFERGNYKYICSITNVGHKDALPLALQVFSHDKIILEQPVLKEKYRSYISQQTVKDINREELSLKESINEMILLVEQDNAKEFFEEWMDPKLYQPYKDTEKIELAIQNGLGSRKQDILKALNTSYAQAPDSDEYLDVKDNIVRFHAGKKDVVYKKVHGRWRFGSK